MSPLHGIVRLLTPDKTIPNKTTDLITPSFGHGQQRSRQPLCPQPLMLPCLLVDDDNNRIGTVFSVYILSNALVDNLKDAIKAKMAPELDYLAVARLTLWKLETPMPTGRTSAEKTEFGQRIKWIEFPDPESDEALQGDGTVQFLDPLEELSAYWPDSDNIPVKRHLYLIGQVPLTQDTQHDIIAPLRNLALSSPAGPIGYTASDLRSIQNTNTRVIGSMPGPSSAAKPKAFRKHNDGPNPIILNLRPSHACGPPITLFHEVFNKFLQDSTNLAVSTSSTRFETIVKFMNVATALYIDEKARQSAVRPLLEDLIGCKFIKIETDNAARIDDVSSVNEFCPLMAEYKHEIGTGGTDGTIQVSFDHAKWAAQHRMRNFREYSCLPSILLALEGPWLCVMGAIYHTTTVVEPLTDFIFCADRPMDQDYYNTLESRIQAQMIPINTSLFPYRITYSFNDEVVTMTYHRWLHQDKLVWVAETARGESVIVKFARRYCSGAHQLLAEAGLVPKLYYADGEDSTEIFRMIVMENIEGTIPLCAVPTPQRPQVFGQIRQALTLLHDNHFVFGDLRPPNILVTKDCQKVMLIDFDWSRKLGVARYPAGGVNPEHAWPDGVEANGRIEIEHDLKWFKTLNT
ncbi:hypothetical protein CPB86DRAFT_876678 [Serendipita vermifera]|nr:hypothetical protein CPB86DRAFT_876678 [Serendipita vermifera]